MDRERLGKVVGIAIDIVVTIGWPAGLIAYAYFSNHSADTKEWVVLIGFFGWFFIVYGTIHLSKILEYKIAGHPYPVEAMKGYFRWLRFKHEDDPPFGG